MADLFQFLPAPNRRKTRQNFVGDISQSSVSQASFSIDELHVPGTWQPWQKMAEGGNKMSGLGPPGLSLAGPPALAQWKKNLQAAPRPIEEGHPFQSSEFAPGHGAICEES